VKSPHFDIRALLLLFALVATGSIQSAAANDAEKIAAIHTIGVISAIGHEAALQNVALMVFGNSDERIAIDDWGLDDAVTANVATLLSGRVEIKPVQYDRVAFATEKRPFLGPPYIPVEDLVAGLTDRDGIDAYLVIVQTELDDPVMGTNQQMGGIGLYRHLFGFKHLIVDYAFYDVELIDARTNKLIKSVVARIGDSGFFNPKFPFVGCAPTIWPETAAAITDAQKQAMKQTATSLVNVSLPWALYELGLLAAKPAEGMDVTCTSP
jgi:hypothetical protein